MLQGERWADQHSPTAKATTGGITPGCKEKVCGVRKGGTKRGNKCQEKKTTLRNIMVKPNIGPNSSKFRTIHVCRCRWEENVVNVLRRRCDDGWAKKFGLCAKSTTVRQVMMTSMGVLAAYLRNLVLWWGGRLPLLRCRLKRNVLGSAIHQTSIAESKQRKE